jgi:hypothetical protein
MSVFRARVVVTHWVHPEVSRPATRPRGRPAPVCARTGHDDVIDVHVALCARERRHAVVTTDPEDLLRIDHALPLIRV